MPSKCRYSFYTLNNPTRTLLQYEQLLSAKDIKYAMQFEKGKGGTRHLQAVLRFKNQVHFNTAKSIFQPEQPHVEVCESPLSSLAYCTKEEGREEGPVSTLSKDEVEQGKRSDLGEVAQAVRSGQSLKRVAEQFTIQFIKYHRGKSLVWFQKL